jgi:hypothetical protein
MVSSQVRCFLAMAIVAAVPSLHDSGFYGQCHLPYTCLYGTLMAIFLAFRNYEGGTWTNRGQGYHMTLLPFYVYFPYFEKIKIDL